MDWNFDKSCIIAIDLASLLKITHLSILPKFLEPLVFIIFLYFRYILRFPTNFNFKIKSLVVLCFCCVPILIGIPHLFWPLSELLLLLIFFIFSLTCLKHISNRKNQQTKKKQRGPHRTGTRFKTWTQYFPKTYKKRYTPRWTCPNSRPSMCPWVSMSFYLYYSKWTKKKLKLNPKCLTKNVVYLKMFYEY